MTSGFFDTSYAYNLIDGLTQVTQGSQTRSFAYDRLGRLTSATNPESGTTIYVYDASSNLTRKTDARDVQTDYNNYDALNRPASISYSDGTPTTTFTYDSVASANGKGRLTGISDGAGSTVFEYDPTGRVSRKRRTTLSVTVQLDYTYNRMGGVKRILVPQLGDTTVDYAFDNAGRQRTLSFNGGSTVVVGDYFFTYGTNGATEFFEYGNGVYESIEYNERLQPFEHAVSRWMGTHLSRTYQFDAPGGGNNGNVWGIADQVNAAYTQQFDYDFWNRITLFTSNGLGSMTFEEYDRWGNRRKQCGSGGAPTMNLTVGTNNRATARRTDSCALTPNQTMGYDAAGNLTSEPGRTYQYDGEGRIKSVNSGAVAAYAYDGEGRRAVKTSGAGTRIYFYDAFGNPILESANAQGAWLAAHAFFNGRHVYENTGQLLWRHVDHLGSAVVRTDVNGGKLGDWRYYPFGERAVGSAAVDPYEFTGKERDAETGLDYFGARYYGNHLGRFTTVDPSRESADPANPQTWNRYAYVLNNPLIYVDPDGEAPHVAVGAAVGGLAGGAMEIYAQVTSGAGHSREMNWAKVLTKTGAGAAIGATATATGGLSVGWQLLAGTTVSVTAGVVDRALDNDPDTSPSDGGAVLGDAVSGGGVFGSAAVVSKTVQRRIQSSAAQRLRDREADRLIRASNARSEARRTAAGDRAAALTGYPERVARLSAGSARAGSKAVAVQILQRGSKRRSTLEDKEPTQP